TVTQGKKGPQASNITIVTNA
nr:cold-shock protein [Acinetobacter baumannii]